MARTRAQENSSKAEDKEIPQKRAKPDDADADAEAEDDQEDVLETHAEDVEEPPAKSAKKEDGDKSIDDPKLRRLLSDHGAFPLQDWYVYLNATTQE